MEKKYPEQLEHIKSLIGKMSKELPGTVSCFSKLHKEALAEGALSTKMKELIALGIGISAGCEGCISGERGSAER
jgi:alkylhydroperoxidase/carboxymuconolactone decarboxylase family protein YurZ